MALGGSMQESLKKARALRQPDELESNPLPRCGAHMKKPYEKPQVRDWGTVAELTATGQTKPGGDMKSGSVASQGQ